MQQGTLAVAELVGVIDGAGTAFGWTRSYCNVVGTAIGAAYRAAGLDEDIDRNAVAPGSAESIAARIVETAELDGLSTRPVDLEAPGGPGPRLEPGRLRYRILGRCGTPPKPSGPEAATPHRPV